MLYRYALSKILLSALANKGMILSQLLEVLYFYNIAHNPVVLLNYRMLFVNSKDNCLSCTEPAKYLFIFGKKFLVLLRTVFNELLAF